MSTRANIIIKDKYDKLFFYRHSDGYPECTGKDLKQFVELYKSKLRSNVSQSAGHLILRGHKEYEEAGLNYDWKVGAYEPTTGLHGDIEYLYVIDLNKGILETRETTSNFWDKATIKNTTLIDKFNFKQDGSQ